MRPRSILFRTLAVLLLGATSLSAQTWYVSGSGDDVAGDGSFGNPYRTITKALSVASTGDDIEIGTGTYNAAAGEVFPLSIPNDVDLRNAPGSGPVIDGDGAPVLLEIGASITLETRITGLSLVDCGVCIDLPAGTSISGQLLIIEDCAFTDFTTAAFQADFSTGSGNQFVLQNCNLLGASAGHGVLVSVRSGADLILGQVEDCLIADCDTGIAILTGDDSTVDDLFMIRRNQISGHTVAGIHVQAQGATGLSTRNQTTVDGNIVSGGAQNGEVGLLMEALHAAGGNSLATVDGQVRYNTFRDNDVNLRLRTTSNGVDARSDLTSDFLGNAFLDATQSGVEFDVTLPVALQPNMAPDFGDVLSDPFETGRNTFRGSALAEWVLDGDMQNVVQAQNNFWDEAIPSADMQLNGALPPNVSPVLDEPLNPIPQPDTISANESESLTLLAGDSSTAFVGNPDADAITNTIQVSVGGNLVSAVVTADGASVVLTTPPMNAGVKTVTVLNAAGQSGSTAIQVVDSGGGGGGGGGGGLCVVATAAWGDYDAREVRVLRAFRDEYLLSTSPGRALTAAYYEHGPPLAAAIARHAWARGLTRALLQPPVLLAGALLEWRAGLRFAAGLLLLLVSLRLLRCRR